ncbi:hypothetical protein [Rhodococcus sp. ACT016]|uniref:hypothetical protein n=1 Tax=Rhodococcus sp. ACT016 TaxID=3134808 RepID=UPI003D274A86
MITPVRSQNATALMTFDQNAATGSEVGSKRMSTSAQQIAVGASVESAGVGKVCSVTACTFLLCRRRFVRLVTARGAGCSEHRRGLRRR